MKGSKVRRCSSRATINLFTLCLSLFAVSYGMILTYLVSQITTLEKRFAFSSRDSGWIASSYEIGFITAILFVSHYAPRFHRPRFIGFGALVIGTAGVVFASPHFIFQNKQVRKGLNAAGANSNFSISQAILYQDLCRHDISQGRSLSNSTCTSSDEENLLNTYAFVIFVLSIAVAGTGPTTIWSIGMAYIDDNVSPEKSSLYLGFMMCLRYVAPILGFLLGAFTATIDVDLEDKGIGPEHPSWIGAWWLGFMICGGLTILCSIPLMLFPRNIQREVTTSLSLPMNKTTSEESEKITENIDEPNTNSSGLASLLAALRRLISNPVYISVTLGFVFLFVAGQGFLIYLPKYIENQFHQTTYVANAIAGTSIALTSAIGIAISGVLTSRVSRSLNQKTCVAFCVMTFCTAAFPFLGLFGCSSSILKEFESVRVSSDEYIDYNVSCLSSSCECSDDHFNPVCQEDGKYFRSPCHAGCQNVIFDNHGQLGYHNCSCATKEKVSTSNCNQGCKAFVPYAVILFTISFLDALTQMPWVMLSVRSVESRDKSLALGLIAFLVSLTTLPVPIIYGTLIDRSCLVKGSKCTNNGFHVACLLYDADRLRYTLHFLTWAIRVVVPILQFFGWYKSRKMNFPEPSNRTPKPEKAIANTGTQAGIEEAEMNGFLQIPDSDTITTVA